jgi:hypothetical protein
MNKNDQDHFNRKSYVTLYVLRRFSLQPNLDTRRKQLDAWCSFVLDYCRSKKVCTFDVNDANKFPPFSNGKIQRTNESSLSLLENEVNVKISIDHYSGQLDSHFIQVLLEELHGRG